MATRSLSRWQKAGALVPMALLVTAWGAALTTNGLANASGTDDAAVPDVPAAALDQPASVQETPGIDPRSGNATAVSTLAQNGIPSAALYAYRRAESLLAKADPDCKLPWNLLAAIGRVESNHGRTNGNTLNSDGVSTPGIYGVALDGKNGHAKINDTDGGALDNDTVYDRAVGPMQFIPGTWKSVGVDGDGDGKKNPQDIDDAATAAGVYLCAGPGDLSTDSGARTAVKRYNHSDSYVDLVMQISAQYAGGAYTESPDSYSVSPVLTNRSDDQTLSDAQRKKAAKAEKKAEEDKKAEQNNGGSTGGTNTGGGTTPGTGTESGTGTGGTSTVLGGTVQGVGDSLGLGGVTKPVTDLLSRTEATLACSLKFPLQIAKQKECLASYGF